MNALDPLAVPLRDTTLIEASAGTGKTWTLATLYLRLLVESGLGVGEILVVTYTNAATAELRDRIRSRLREAVTVFEREADGRPGASHADPDGPLACLVARCREAGTLPQTGRRLRDALRGFDEAAIFTIHGFCQRVLLENAFESGVSFDAELVTDERPLCSEVVQDFWVSRLHAAPPALVKHLEAKHGPADLERLARLVLSSRDMPVLPKDAPKFEPQRLEEPAAEWDAALRAAHEAWPGCRDAVQRALTDKTLDGRQYRRDWVAGWCAQLHADLAAALAGLPADFRNLDRFTPERIALAVKTGQRPPSHPFFACCARLLAAKSALDAECARQAHAFEGALVAHVGDEVRSRHEAANTQSFDDLLYRLRAALDREDERGELLARQIRERFRAALIDEFQDTDPVQYRIFERVYRGTGQPLFLIGDPKQAIYAFRGADVFTYVTAKGAAGSNAHTLQVNHRSAPELVEGVNALFARVRAPFVFDAIPFGPVRARGTASAPLGGAIAARPPLEILFVSRPAGAAGDDRPAKDWAKRQVPQLVAAEVVALLESRPTIGDRELHAGDVAVLCRTNQQAVDVQDALRELGVPSVRQGDDSVFESPEAEEIERVLRAVAEPGDPRLLRAALATRLFGYDAGRLEHLQGAEDEWDELADHFRDWLETWTTLGFMAAFRKLLGHCDTQRRLLEIDDGERRLTNLLHVAELLQAASREAHRGPLGLVDWLSLMRSDPAARAELASEAAQIRLESDAKAVQLVTIHRSKGLEYGVVFCPYTWDGSGLRDDEKRWIRFHDESDGVLKLDLGSDDRDAHLARADLESFAESLRLLYVALTRARHRCTVVWGCVKSDELTPLGYLLHQDRAAEPAGLMTATRSRIDALGPAARLDELKLLAAEVPAGIAVREVVLPLSPPPHPLAPSEEASADLVAPGRGPVIDAPWRVSSFSGLAASGGRSSHKAEEGLDHDAVGATDDDTGRTAAPTIRLHDLPKGARTGELLHAILEKIDFRRTDPDQLGLRVRTELDDYLFDAKWEAPIRLALEEVLATPIPAGDTTFRLADVASGQRLDELQFLFAVRAGFDREKLARCFERHPSPGRTDDYPARIRDLGFKPLAGYLGGFVDLVFQHGGRWYVVDYKSNLLGTGPADYAPERLRRAMSQHHYHLQYHLYVLALQRYLTLRVPGFDFARDFGGVAYLFLRGMSPRHPEGCGVFFERPSPELLHDLSDLVGPVEGRER